MVSITNFGSFPGVRVQTYGTTISNVQIGAEEKLILFGEGNVAEGDASVGEAVNTNTPRSIDRQFGGDTQLGDAIRKTRGNGANASFTYGAVVRSNWKEDEEFGSSSNTSTGTLSNAPLFGEDSDGNDVTSYVSFYDVNEDVELTVNLVDSGGSPATPSTENTVNIDYVTGDWDADVASHYKVTYQYFNNYTEGTETDSGSATDGELNAPLIEDKDRVRVFDTASSFGDGNELTVEFRYGEGFSAPTDSDTIAINPITGEWNANTTITDTLNIFYVPKNFSDTFDDVDGTVNENETGIYVPITRSNTVSTTLDSKINSLRTEYKLVQAITALQPNGTVNGEPYYNTGGSLGDTVDNDAFYRVAPVDEEGSAETALPAVAGNFAGTLISEPVYGNTLSGVESLVQKLKKSERDELRDEFNVIPLKELGSISIDGNTSTSTATDYARTFFVRRIIDRIILLSKVLGDAVIGRKNTEQNRKLLRNELVEEIEDLVEDDVLQPNDGEDRNWYVEVSASEFNEVAVEVGVTPVGVIKRIDEEIIIDTSV
jgi:hypothetical protein